MEEEAVSEAETERVGLGEPLKERAALPELYCEGVQVALTVTALVPDCERVGDSVAQAEGEPEREHELLAVCVSGVTLSVPLEEAHSVANLVGLMLALLLAEAQALAEAQLELLPETVGEAECVGLSVGASEPAPVAVEEALAQALAVMVALRRRLPVALGLRLPLALPHCTACAWARRCL
jgi:hypothetical protein